MVWSIFWVSESQCHVLHVLNRSVELDDILFELVIQSFGGDFRLAESGFDLRIHDSVLYWIIAESLVWTWGWKPLTIWSQKSRSRGSVDDANGLWTNASMSCNCKQLHQLTLRNEVCTLRGERKIAFWQRGKSIFVMKTCILERIYSKFSACGGPSWFRLIPLNFPKNPLIPLILAWTPPPRGGCPCL